MGQLNLNDIYMRYGAFEALKGINANIEAGEFVVIVGPSGCGKSSLLRAIAGLEKISSGSIVLDKDEIHRMPASKRGLAMVFQNYALYPQKTVEQNMGFALQMAKVPKDEIKERVVQAAKILQIEELLTRKPGQLSGGQRQRVAIGRAIVRKPKVFLFDEPLSNLDASLRVEMRVELANLHKSLDATMIYVTHDQIEAMTMADRVIVLNGGEVAQIGPPLELFEKPHNTFVAGFIGSPKMNMIDGSVVRAEATQVQIEFAGGNQFAVPVPGGRLSQGDQITLGIRPEHITLESGSEAMSMRVTLVEYLGEESIVYGVLKDGTKITVKTPYRANCADQEETQVNFRIDRTHLFDDEGNAIR